MREDMARIPDVLIEARQGRDRARPTDLMRRPEHRPTGRRGRHGCRPGPALAATAADLPPSRTATPPAPVPAPMTADPVEPEPIVPADDIAEALAAGVDTHAIPQEPPPETDQMRLF